MCSQLSKTKDFVKAVRARKLAKRRKPCFKNQFKAAETKEKDLTGLRKGIGSAQDVN